MGRWCSGLCVFLDLSGILYRSPVVGCSSRGIVLGSAYTPGAGALSVSAAGGGGDFSLQWTYDKWFMFLGPILTHWTDQKEGEKYGNSIACG